MLGNEMVLRRLHQRQALGPVLRLQGPLPSADGTEGQGHHSRPRSGQREKRLSAQTALSRLRQQQKLLQPLLRALKGLRKSLERVIYHLSRLNILYLIHIVLYTPYII